ncbi:carbohydrate sulfotransferase 11-like isoform X2 [Portunus trituberculatus]|nr:carbohydrate sulfotransferase 11-like isoform X2 [Portunus trituberculatus]XP_045136781.1 carbohydrate sulfotransferase 11-like isoform X2 [Portunus trituberculatus]
MRQSGLGVNIGGSNKMVAESGDDAERQRTLRWEEEQQRRKTALRQACRKWSPKATEYLPNGKKDLIFLLVDDRHKALYCFVPKVSCTTWKSIWMILTGMTTIKNPLDIKPYVPHLLQEEMMLAKQPYNTSVLENKLNTYTKLLIVRDPYERLLSAYKNKLEHGKNHTYWGRYVRQIIKYNKKHGAGANTEFTFSAFVNYVNSLTEPHFNEHWRPYHQLCFPCAIKYDVIAKYETLTDDSERFLRLIGAPDDLHYPSYLPSKTASLLPQYMANLSRAQRHDLYQVYRRDFEAFQYQPFGGLV